jgi:branched-chain amino acid transport system permease protein
LFNGLITGSIYALTAFGFTIVFGTMNFFNLAHGSAFMIGAYMTYLFFIIAGLNLPVSMVFGSISTMIIMVCFDRLLFQPFRESHEQAWVLAICSFAVSFLIEPIISLLFGTDILSIRQREVAEIYKFMGIIITRNQIIILSVSIMIMILLTLFFRKTSYGKAMRATADDPEIANVIGINVDSIFLLCMAIGSVLAGAAGALISLEIDLDSTMSHSALLKAIVASILGGIGNISGAMFGGIFLGIVENLGIWKIESSWKDGISLGIMMVFVVLKPYMHNRRG